MPAQKHLDNKPLNEVFEVWKADILSIDCGVHEAVVADEEKEKTNTELQHEARSYFQTRVSKNEEALAQLIRDLGPSFKSTSLPTRLRGLCVLLGAIEGCKNTPISNSSLVYLGKFLSIHCGPIVDDEYEEDYDSMIRDVSVKCLSALIETPTTAVVTPSKSKSDQAGAISKNGKECADALGIRVNFAKEGVERRCATPEDGNVDDEMRTDSDELYYNKDIRGGLSTMPRSKRSLCFTLLHSAVVGVSKITSAHQSLRQQDSTTIPSIQIHFIQFAEFLARCIHGESDPRCLLQLLELLHTTQLNFCDWFLLKNMKSHNNVFPNEDFFDAVAPYFPIAFTPPPNNIHGITREGLHSALISVLTFTKMDEGARRYHKPTILGCSIHLFLEQLLPGQVEDENPSALEKLEVLECISSLLFPTSKERDGKQTGEEISMESECANLAPEEVRNLSTALIATHDEASVAVTLHGGDLSDQNKILAEKCRKLASLVAKELEKCNKSGKQKLWDIFVAEQLEKEMKKLKLTPAYAKTSIAYEASLAASGGPRTLRKCLANGLVPLLEYLRGHSDDASDNTLAAIHGISAFFSSSQVAVSEARKVGIELTPHPLESYAKDTCNLLLDVVEAKGPPYSLPLKTAASSCLECLFLSSIARHLESEEIVNRICLFLSGLLENIMVSLQVEGPDDQDGLVQYRNVSSDILGRVIGVAMTEYDDNDEIPIEKTLRSVFSIPEIRDYVRSEIYPKLMDATFGCVERYEGVRLDRMALSTACSSSPKLASAVIGAHLEALLNTLKVSITSRSSRTCMEALSYILRSCAGDNAFRAFHESDAVDDIIDLLCNDLTHAASSELRESISQIALPTTSGTENSMKSKIKSISVIVSGLIPAFNRSVPRKRLHKLLKAISDKIPPLSQADEGVLIVRLPIMSAALQVADPSLLEEVVSEIDSDEGLPVTQLLEGLTEYVLSNEHLSSARGSGAFCVHALLKNGFNRNLDCPARPLLDSINNRILSSTDDIRVTKNCLNFLSLISSAAALRGASSSSTADGIARFLMEAACDGRGQLPFRGSLEDGIIDFSALFKDESAQIALRVISASAYGAIIMEDEIKSLMKQRLTHICVKYIKKISDEDEQTQRTELSNIGPMMMVCYVVAANDILKFDRATKILLATFLVKGLSTDLFQISSRIPTKLPAEAAKARTLVICTLLKFLCTAPAALNGLVFEIVSGLLRSYAISDPTTDIGCKLITLQALEVLAHLEEEKNSILAVKPAVIAILSSAMSQKNVLLRSAAVDVRNMWCLVV